jgi:hypothetical protein
LAPVPEQVLTDSHATIGDLEAVVIQALGTQKRSNEVQMRFAQAEHWEQIPPSEVKQYMDRGSLRLDSTITVRPRIGGTMRDWPAERLRYLIHFSDGGSGMRYRDSKLRGERWCHPSESVTSVGVPTRPHLDSRTQSRPTCVEGVAPLLPYQQRGKNSHGCANAPAINSVQVWAGGQSRPAAYGRYRSRCPAGMSRRRVANLSADAAPVVVLLLFRLPEPSSS